VGAIQLALQSEDYCINNGIDFQYKPSDIFDALFLSLDNRRFFQFEGMDSQDMYFSLRGECDELIRMTLGGDPCPPYFPSCSTIEVPTVDLTDFETLMREVEDLTRVHASRLSRYEKLTRNNAEMERELGDLTFNGDLKFRLRKAQDTLAKLSGV
jgi:hypothetical protein